MKKIVNVKPKRKDKSLISEDDEKSIWVKTIVKSLLYSQTHGLPNIVRTKLYLVKVIWTLAFLTALGLVFYRKLNHFTSNRFSFSLTFIYLLLCCLLKIKVCVVNMVTFMSNNAATVSVDWIEEQPSTFPAVTICNLRLFDTGRPGVLANLTRLLAEVNINMDIDADSDQSVLEQIKSKTAILKAQIAAQGSIDPYGFLIDDMLLSCRFDTFPCSAADFVKFYLYDYGICYTFNFNASGQTPKLAQVARTRTGLRLELFAGNGGGELSLETGFYVVVHNNSEAPNKYEGVRVSTGFSTEIGVRRRFHYKLPTGGCRLDTRTIYPTDSTFFGLASSLNNTIYSKRLCYEICLQDAIENGCGCSDPSLVTFSLLPQCTSTSQMQCALDYNTFFDTFPTWANDRCGDKCPQECNSVTYSTTLSSCDYVNSFRFRLIKCGIFV